MRKLYHQSSLRCREICGHYNLPNHNIQMSSWIFSESRYRNTLIQMQSKPPRTQWNLNLPRWNLWQCRNNLIQMQSKPPRTQWNLNLPRWNLWQPSHHRKISYSKKMKSASNIFIFIFIYIYHAKQTQELTARTMSDRNSEQCKLHYA